MSYIGEWYTMERVKNDTPNIIPRVITDVAIMSDVCVWNVQDVGKNYKYGTV